MDNKKIWSLLLILLGIEFLFLALNCIDLPAYILTRSFNLDGESNIPTWFSSIQLFAIGLISLACFKKEYTSLDFNSMGWIVLLIIFWSLSLDEVASLHELTAKAIAKHYDLEAFRIRGFVWVYLLAPFAVVAALYMAYFFISRFKQVTISLRLGIAGLLFWALVIPMEYLGGRYADSNLRYWESHFYKFLTNLEEMAEMVGASLILTAFLFYFNHSHCFFETITARGDRLQ